MYTPEELVTLADERVARAIHLFDTWGEHPREDRAIERTYEIPVNWRDAIPGPLTSQDMGSDDECVLARVMTLAGADAWGSYQVGLELLDMAVGDAIQYGFVSQVSQGLQYVDLAEAWNRALGHV